jgi:hypothetical protein
MVQRLFWNSQSFNGSTAHYERWNLPSSWNGLKRSVSCTFAQMRNLRFEHSDRSLTASLGAVLGVQRHGSDRGIATGKKEKNT